MYLSRQPFLSFLHLTEVCGLAQRILLRNTTTSLGLQPKKHSPEEWGKGANNSSTMGESVKLRRQEVYLQVDLSARSLRGQTTLYLALSGASSATPASAAAAAGGGASTATGGGASASAAADSTKKTLRVTLPERLRLAARRPVRIVSVTVNGHAATFKVRKEPTWQHAGPLSEVFVKRENNERERRRNETRHGWVRVRMEVRKSVQRTL